MFENDTTQRLCECGRPARAHGTTCETCRKRAARDRRRAAQPAQAVPTPILYGLLLKRLEGRYALTKGDVTTLTTPSQMRLVVGLGDDGAWWWRIYARANETLARGSEQSRNAALNKMWEMHCGLLAEAHELAQRDERYDGALVAARGGYALPRHMRRAVERYAAVTPTPENEAALFYETAAQHDDPVYEHDSVWVRERFIAPAEPLQMPGRGGKLDGAQRAMALLAYDKDNFGSDGR